MSFEVPSVLGTIREVVAVLKWCCRGGGGIIEVIVAPEGVK